MTTTHLSDIESDLRDVIAGCDHLEVLIETLEEQLANAKKRLRDSQVELTDLLHVATIPTSDLTRNERLILAVITVAGKPINAGQIDRWMPEKIPSSQRRHALGKLQTKQLIRKGGGDGSNTTYEVIES